MVNMKPAKTPYSLTAPQRWDEMPWGEYFNQSLNQHLHPYLSKLYGSHLLKMGQLSAAVETDSCPISHQFTLQPGLAGGGVAGEATRLPFLSKSIDACLLVHALAWEQDPHQVLREADRVLIDDGWLILTGFNPYSLLGAGKLLPGVRRRSPWNSKMFSQGRLLDWLSVLNYEIICRKGCQVVPWRKQGGQFLSAHLPALGCINILVARKRTYPLTLNKNSLPAGRARIRTAVNVSRQCSEAKPQDPEG